MNNCKPKMLLHVCCASCLMHPYILLKESYDVTLFFYNPNIYPEDEYRKRFSETLRISGKFKIPMIAGRCEKKKWFKHTSNFANEPEGGKRCSACFDMRLVKAATEAKKNKFDIFASTLSVSPHKNAAEINRIGKQAAEKLRISYLQSDFKKQDGYKKTVELSGHLEIYRQNYCGCIYSFKEIKK